MEHPVVNLMESQWKLRKQHDQNFNGGKVIVEQILASEKRKKSKQEGPWDLSRKVNHLSKVV